MTISRNETQCSIWSIFIEKNVVASGIFWPQRNKANHNKAKFGLTAIFEMSTLWLYVWAVSNALNVHLKLLKCIKKEAKQYFESTICWPDCWRRLECWRVCWLGEQVWCARRGLNPHKSCPGSAPAKHSILITFLWGFSNRRSVRKEMVW